MYVWRNVCACFPKSQRLTGVSRSVTPLPGCTTVRSPRCPSRGQRTAPVIGASKGGGTQVEPIWQGHHHQQQQQPLLLVLISAQKLRSRERERERDERAPPPPADKGYVRCGACFILPCLLLFSCFLSPPFLLVLLSVCLLACSVMASCCCGDSPRSPLLCSASIRFDSVRFGSVRFDSIRFDSIRLDPVRFHSVASSGEGGGSFRFRLTPERAIGKRNYKKKTEKEN